MHHYRPRAISTPLCSTLNCAYRADETEHVQRLCRRISTRTGATRNARLLKRCELPEGLTPEQTDWHYFPPHLYEIGNLSLLEREVFGPILHLMRYSASELDSVIDAVNATGYGLTFGIHSRLDSTAQRLR